MDGSTEEQLGLIRRVVAVMRAADTSAWLFGGWGLDARLGRITRDHGDVEFWVEHGQGQRSKVLLTEAGAIPLLTQPPEESCEFTWDGVSFSTAYFDRQPDGTITLKGRWSDWQLPAESFGDDPGILGGLAVPTMSAAGMLAMKEQFPNLRNGRPWREKDREDIEVLRALVNGQNGKCSTHKQDASGAVCGSGG
jgi:lincosamide nucleotidyltransferase A/C/D/E